MRFVSVCLSAIAVLGVATACSQEQYYGMKEANPTGSAFSQNLFSGYKTLAENEHAEHDVWDADYFAGKAMATTDNVDVLPQAIGDRDLPPESVDELSAARGELLRALAAGAAEKAPADTARAQIMFDCWMQEQEENHQPRDIAACRDGFNETMGRIELALAPAPAPVAKVEPKAVPAAVVEPAEAIYVVYFDFDKATIDDASNPVLAEAAAAARKLEQPEILIVGNTDTAGPETYNMTLSKERAEAVARVLISKGLAASALKMQAYGENRPVIETADGVREEGNRRVEIVVRR